MRLARVLCTGCLSLAPWLASTAQAAEAYPSKPIRWIVAYAAGGEPTPSDPSAMANHWRNESAYWPKFIQERNIALE